MTKRLLRKLKVKTKSQLRKGEDQKPVAPSEGGLGATRGAILTEIAGSKLDALMSLLVFSDEDKGEASDNEKEEKSMPPSKRIRTKHSQTGADEYNLSMKYLDPNRVSRLLVIFGAILSAMCVCDRFLEKECEGVEQNHPVEFFDGVGMIWQRARQLGLKARGFGVDRGPHEDVLTDEGVMVAIRRVRSIVAGGMSCWATPCSSWVTINTGISERTNHSPCGAVRRPSVSSSNTHFCRFVLLMILGQFLGQVRLLEQPGLSLMGICEWMLRFLQAAYHLTIRPHMGAFNVNTRKRTTLWVSSDWMGQLSQKHADIPKKVREAMKEKSNVVTTVTFKMERNAFKGRVHSRRPKSTPLNMA